MTQAPGQTKSPRFEERLERCEAEIRRNPHLASAHLQRAVLLQSLQRYGEALRSYEEAIKLDPGLADAHYHRANLLHSLRRFDDAVTGYDRAISAQPRHASAWKNKARALRVLRRLDEALRSSERAVALAPGDADAHLNRGNVLTELNRPEEALRSYERATALKPDLVEAQFNYANTASRLGRLEDALQRFDRAIALRPGFAEAHHGRANLLQKLARPDEALRGFGHAIALKPDFAEAHNNKGNVLCQLGRHAEAVDSYARAVTCRPDYALAWNNRSSALKDLDRLEDALESSDRAIMLAPDLAIAYYNRGNVLKGMQRLPEAVRSFDRAIELAPDFEDAHKNRATTTLLMGNFERGWELYERRNAGATTPHSGHLPGGDENLQGKALLIRAEQGLGDTIQFCRYALLAAARGADVTLAVQDPLVTLLKCLQPRVTITGMGTPSSGFDYHVPLLSLPRLFRTRMNNIPATIPYLAADSNRIETWKKRIGTSGYRIGICWQGAAGGEVDVGRSFPVRHFETIAGISGLRLISLQKNAGVEQLLDLPSAMRVETFGDALDAGPDAFVDTAALMESLDLVITSDTAVAHLAGALGRPVWVALSHVPDWRWLMDRKDSTWYPTMTLFRQPARGDWAGIFAAMRTSLSDLLSAPECRR